MNIARICAILALGAITYEGRRLFPAQTSPVGWYCLPLMAVLAYQEVWLPDLPFGARVSGLIVASALSLVTGVVIGQSMAPKRPKRVMVLRSRIGVIVPLLIALAFLASAVLNLYLTRQQLGTGLGREGGIFYRQRFFDEVENSGTLRLLQALTYSGAFYLAAVFRVLPRGRLLVLVYLAVAFLQGVLISTKASPLLAALIIAITSMTMVDLPRSRWRLQTAVPVLLVLVAVLGSFYVVTTQRSAGKASVTATLQYSLAGGPSALSMVLDGDALLDDDGPFGLTVGGLQEALGLGDRKFGMFDQVVTLQPGVPESVTNIYTWFAPLQHDFGLGGSLVVILGLGLVAGGLAGRLRAGQLGASGRCALALVGCVLVDAPITVLTYYNFIFLLIALVPAIGAVVHFVELDESPSVATHTPAAREPVPQFVAS